MASQPASMLHPTQAGEPCAHQHETRHGLATRSQAAASGAQRIQVASAWSGQHPRRRGRNLGGLLEEV